VNLLKVCGELRPVDAALGTFKVQDSAIAGSKEAT
jgi:hypothetical protein